MAMSSAKHRSETVIININSSRGKQLRGPVNPNPSIKLTIIPRLAVQFTARISSHNMWLSLTINDH